MSTWLEGFFYFSWLAKCFPPKHRSKLSYTKPAHILECALGKMLLFQHSLQQSLLSIHHLHSLGSSRPLDREGSLTEGLRTACARAPQSRNVTFHGPPASADKKAVSLGKPWTMGDDILSASLGMLRITPAQMSNFSGLTEEKGICQRSKPYFQPSRLLSSSLSFPKKLYKYPLSLPLYLHPSR